MPRLTATDALRNVLAQGWQSDALARDTAVQALVNNGYETQAAERAVDIALAKMMPKGAN